MHKSITKNAWILCAFAVATTFLIALTHFGTRDRIVIQQQQKLRGLLNEVVPTAIHDNKLDQDCVVLTNAILGSNHSYKIYRARMADTPVALAIEGTAPNGYSGAIDLIVGVDMNGTVLGSRIISHKETPGLGDKIELSVSDWILSFNGKPYSESLAPRWKVKKDGGDFDQFTGATITPRAVVGTVARLAQFAGEQQANIFAMPNQCVTEAPSNE